MNLLQIDNEDDIQFTKSKSNNYGIQFEGNCPICYSPEIKKFISEYGSKPGHPFLGIVLFNNKQQKEVHVLYKDFLLQNPIKVSATVKDRYMQTYLRKKYKMITNYIIQQMPRVKKLKRLNLKMINRQMASYLYTYLNDIIDSYMTIYGYEKAQIFKASLTTTPFYIEDQGIIKIYHMDRNEIELPEYEGANFLSYFTFSY